MGKSEIIKICDNIKQLRIELCFKSFKLWYWWQPKTVKKCY